MTDVVNRHRLRAWCHINPLKAADRIERLTEALQIMRSLVKVGNVSDCYKMAMRREIAATIERCAQVADSFPSGMDKVKAKIAKDIAAEIRALKDKP